MKNDVDQRLKHDDEEAGSDDHGIPYIDELEIRCFDGGLGGGAEERR